MKVIGAYAIATAMTPQQVLASGLLMGVILLVIGTSGAIDAIRGWTPKAVVRGVQLSTGLLLMAQGVRFMLGTTTFQVLRQAAEPHLTVQHLGPVPIGIVIGLAGGALTLALLESRRFPAGLAVILAGVAVGVVLGTRDGLDRLALGFYLPRWMPYGLPSGADFTFALLALVLPQVPMTLGNAVIANADLSAEYFGQDSRRVTCRALCVSMGLANLASFALGGMPLCHGAGGLAAHYRFGARSAGSNLMIGAAFAALALLLGFHALSLVYLLPMAILGVLLLFAGSQLALTVADVDRRKDLFVVLVMAGITLASNLAAAFLVGIVVARALRMDLFKV